MSTSNYQDPAWERALDAKIREELRKWPRHLHDQLKITSILVTHDQEEALEVANRVVVLNEGKIEQVGTPDELYHKPATPFVYSFLGNVNLFRGRIANGRVYVRGGPIVLDSGSRQLINSNGKDAMVCVRPDLMEIALTPSGEASFPATARHINAAGPKVNVELESQWGDTVYVETDEDHFRDLAIKRDAHVFLKPRENHVFILPDMARDRDSQPGQHGGAQDLGSLN
jgi:sulfate/thiosulfate transport system ATP-binding protein